MSERKMSRKQERNKNLIKTRYKVLLERELLKGWKGTKEKRKASWRKLG